MPGPQGTAGQCPELQRGKEAQTHFWGQQQQQSSCPHGLGRMCCLPRNNSEVMAQKKPQKQQKKEAFVWLLCARAWPCIRALLINANDPCPKRGLFSPHKKKNNLLLGVKRSVLSNKQGTEHPPGSSSEPALFPRKRPWRMAFCWQPGRGFCVWEAAGDTSCAAADTVGTGDQGTAPALGADTHRARLRAVPSACPQARVALCWSSSCRSSALLPWQEAQSCPWHSGFVTAAQSRAAKRCQLPLQGWGQSSAPRNGKRMEQKGGDHRGAAFFHQ